MNPSVKREKLVSAIKQALRDNPVVALTGPRQCGKTTLARALVTGVRNARIFDLEDPVTLARFADPMTALEALRGLVVIDEVQRAPHLFPVLRVLADRAPLPARFLLLGSASPNIARETSESLAGRAAFIDMSGFMLDEVGAEAQRKLWLRGGFPRAFLARSEAQGFAWREDFIRTFLERDIRNFGVNVPPLALRRLWMMLAHYHGQMWSASEISRSLGESHPTVKRHVDILTGALVVRQLQPWFENLGKRQVKSSKVYVRDTGLLHALLGIASFSQLEAHPKLGASWEGFVVEQVLACVGERNAWYWATQSGAELDLLVMRGGKRYGIEVKYGDAPRPTKSMAIAITDLRLEHLFVVYPRRERYAMNAHTTALSLESLLNELSKLGAKR